MSFNVLDLWLSGLYKHAPRTPINSQIIIRINLNANLKPNQINVPLQWKAMNLYTETKLFAL